MIISFLRMTLNLLWILVLVNVLLRLFLDPYHPVRVSIERIVEPLLSPIRQIIPPIAMIDFSPMVLLILIQVVDRILLELF